MKIINDKIPLMIRNLNPLLLTALPEFVANPIWINRTDYVRFYFEKECKDVETITVTAESLVGVPLIAVYYQTVRNKKHVECKFGLSPALLALLSDLTTSIILEELLAYFRRLK